jgi:hypothetical protein
MVMPLYSSIEKLIARCWKRQRSGRQLLYFIIPLTHGDYRRLLLVMLPAGDGAVLRFR